MKKIILLILLLSMFSCQKQNTVDKKEAATVVNYKMVGGYIGTYKGILPCADCQGIEMELAINENKTFSIKKKYLEKGDKVFVQKGHFTWNKKGNIIILTDVKNEINRYLVGKNKLTQLDSYGEKITGNLADEYILSKQPADTSEIETTEDDKAIVDLDSRIATTTEIKTVNPAVGKYPLAETKWKLISLNKKTVDQTGKDVYYIKLKSKDGRFVALSGCNNILGNYVMPSPTTLTFSKIVSTKMACADMELESYFFSMLGLTHSYKIENQILTLFGDDKKELGKFEVVK